MTVLELQKGPQHRKTKKNDLCAQQGLKTAWTSAQSDQSLYRPPEETLGPYLPIEHTVKTLARLHECAGWSESSLAAHVILLFYLHLHRLINVFTFLTFQLNQQGFVNIKKSNRSNIRNLYCAQKLTQEKARLQIQNIACYNPKCENEPRHDKTNKNDCAPSLIRVFSVRSMGS